MTVRDRAIPDEAVLFCGDSSIVDGLYWVSTGAPRWGLTWPTRHPDGGGEIPATNAPVREQDANTMTAEATMLLSLVAARMGEWARKTAAEAVSWRLAEGLRSHEERLRRLEEQNQRLGQHLAELQEACAHRLSLAIVTAAGATFELRRPIEAVAYLEEGAWIHEAAEFGLCSYGETREESLQALHDEFAFCWQAYAMAAEDQLTPDAQRLGAALRAIVAGVEE